MNNTNDHKYFLSVGFKKISFAVLTSKNKLLFKKEILVESLSVGENIEALEIFLNKNIFEIEKHLGDYVKEIYLITTSVIMVISGNLVLSLGMVGALSIVRFRAAVKDPLDIVFMFWAVSIGIANGVAAFKVSFAATIIISLIVIIL